MRLAVTSFLKPQRLQGLNFLKVDLLLTVRFLSSRNAELDVVENVLLARELNSYRKFKNETRFSKPRRKRPPSSHLLRAAALKMPIAGLLRSSLHLRRNFKLGKVKSIWLSWQINRGNMLSEMNFLKDHLIRSSLWLRVRLRPENPTSSSPILPSWDPNVTSPVTIIGSCSTRKTSWNLTARRASKYQIAPIHTTVSWMPSKWLASVM